MAEPGAWAAAGARGGGAPRALRVLPAPRPRARPAAPLVLLRPRLGPGGAFPFYLLYHCVGAEMRGQALARAAAAAATHRGAPRADPGAARPPRSSWRRREPGTAPGRRGRASRGQQAGQAAPRPGLRRRGGAARTRGRFPSSLFLFCLRFPQQRRVFIFWRVEKARGRGDLGQLLVSAARWHPRGPEK